MATKVVMAQLSPTMEEGKLLEWKVAEGDISNLGDVSTLADPSVVQAIIDGAHPDG